MRFLAFLSHHENSADCAKIKDFQFEDTSSGKKPSDNFLLGKFKAIAMEK